MYKLARATFIRLKNHQEIGSYVRTACKSNIQSRYFANQTVVHSKLTKNFIFGAIHCQKRLFATDANTGESLNTLNQFDFENYCAETLESLSDYFDELVENSKDLEAADVINKDGVLTISLGNTHGTYVINKQSPNKQIWLSSPRSGPKRFDFMFTSSATGANKKSGYWIYRHTGVLLHELLDNEFSEITRTKTKFQALPFGSKS